MEQLHDESGGSGTGAEEGCHGGGEGPLPPANGGSEGSDPDSDGDSCTEKNPSKEWKQPEADSAEEEDDETGDGFENNNVAEQQPSVGRNMDEDHSSSDEELVAEILRREAYRQQHGPWTDEELRQVGRDRRELGPTLVGRASRAR